jgi:MFS family permease
MLAFRPPLERPLRRAEQIRGMRDMLYVGAFAMPYATIVGVAGPIFAGLMLQMGIEKASIGLIVSFAQITGLIQMASFRLTSSKHPRALVVGVGTLEILLTVSVISVPLWVPADWTFTAVVALVVLGWSSAYIHVPTFNSWFASVIPAELRGRYISKRTFIQFMIGIATSLVAGKFIDLVPGYSGFAVLYLVATAFGLACYWVMYRTPMPRLAAEEDSGIEEESHLQRLARPMRDTVFRRFIFFNIVWTLVIMLPGPYYNVFMIDQLQFSYSMIAILTSIQMIVMGFGFRFWGAIVDKFGGKPMIELLFVPTIIMPSLWAFASVDSYWTVPVAMIIGGLGYSGISIANSIMLYSIVPQDGEKSSYFAIWSMATGVASGLGPAIGSGVLTLLGGTEISLLGWTFGSYHVLFALTSVCGVFPALLVLRLSRLGSERPGHMINQITRGNPFSLAYNYFLLSRVDQPARQANLLRSLGRSRSPLALNKLIVSLDHPEPAIRRSATLALGDTGSAEAVDVLLERLVDTESDLRCEAARALGALGVPTSVTPLTEALSDGDTELRVAAAEALGRISGEAACTALVEVLDGPFDRTLFPTAFDGLSRAGKGMGDLRVVRRAARLLPRFGSHAVRLQVVNSIARALGFGDEYARLALADPYDRDSSLHRSVTRTRRHTTDLPWPEDEALDVVMDFESMVLHLTEGDDRGFLDRAHNVTRHICGRFGPDNDADDSEPVSAIVECCAAISIMYENGELIRLESNGLAFTTLALELLARLANTA